MNAEELEIARRLVACPKWVWLPGMRIAAGHGWRAFRLSAEAHRAEFLPGYLPDLDDDLTRLGVLAVVRRAWGDETASVRFLDRWPLKSVWEYRGRWVSHGPTELAALLAALEAAP